MTTKKRNEIREKIAELRASGLEPKDMLSFLPVNLSKTDLLEIICEPKFYATLVSGAVEAGGTYGPHTNEDDAVLDAASTIEGFDAEQDFLLILGMRGGTENEAYADVKYFEYDAWEEIKQIAEADVEDLPLLIGKVKEEEARAYLEYRMKRSA